MAITQTPEGWTFDRGQQTYGPYPTRDAAAEALFDAERGNEPSVSDWLIAELERLESLRDADVENASLDERIANARLDAMYAEEERMRHGTLLDPGGPGRVRIERQVCDDVVDTARYGLEWGTNFTAGEGDDEVEVFIPDSPELGKPDIYFLGQEGLLPADVRRVLPNIVLLLTDPRVVAALASQGTT